MAHIESIDYLFNEKLRPDETLKLLDLCCGVGQLLKELWQQEKEGDENHRPWRNRIQYHGVDLSTECINGAQSCAPNLGFTNPPTFNKSNVLERVKYYNDCSFHMVAYVNSLHEQAKWELPELLYEMFRVVRDDGRVFIFDITGLKHAEREIGSLPLSSTSVKALFQEFEKQYSRDDPMLGKALAIRTYNGEKRAWDKTTPASAWYSVIQCDRKIQSDGPTVKSRMLGLFKGKNKQKNFRVLMRREVKKLRTEIFNEIYRLSDVWKEHYVPQTNMGVSFDRDKQDFDYSPPSLNLTLVPIEEELDIKVRDYWACDHELKNLA